ncbi:MAG: 50S ribosomal protein L9 [Phycisphaerales bacterium]|nr:50S ribosomal protein L9 [Phycisphaerales bacterium]
MAKNIELLLTENVEALGIVGDVVKVRTGYARNFLLPRDMATKPSEEKIKELSAKRAEAQRMLAEQRKQREELSQKLEGVEVHLIRSCNDQGILYGAITQQDIATELGKMGHGVKPRDIRLSQVIKRIDTYDIHVKLDSDLDTIIKLWVVADRKLDLERHHEPEPAAAAAEGAEAKDAKPAKPEVVKGEWGPKADAGDGEHKKPKKAKGDETHADKGDGEKKVKADKAPKAEKAEKGDGEKKAKKAK